MSFQFNVLHILFVYGHWVLIRQLDADRGRGQFSPQSNAQIIQIEQEAWHGLEHLIFTAWSAPHIASRPASTKQLSSFRVNRLL